MFGLSVYGMSINTCIACHTFAVVGAHPDCVGQQLAFGDKPTTSVIGYNDLMSIGLMRELTRQGASVPDDVSIIGFDDISDAALCSPSLTTVAAPLDLLGRAAVETPLAQTSRCSAVAARSAMLPADLVVRGSAGPRGARPALSTAV